MSANAKPREQRDYGYDQAKQWEDMETSRKAYGKNNHWQPSGLHGKGKWIVGQSNSNPVKRSWGWTNDWAWPAYGVGWAWPSYGIAGNVVAKRHWGGGYWGGRPWGGPRPWGPPYNGPFVGYPYPNYNNGEKF